MYETAIERKSSKLSKAFPKIMGEEVKSILIGLMERAREYALASSYVFQRTEKGELKDGKGYVNSGFYSANFDKYCQQLTSYAEASAKTENPIEALRLLERNPDVIGTGNFGLESLVGFPANLDALRGVVDESLSRSQDELLRRAALVRRVGHEFDEKTQANFYRLGKNRDRPGHPSNDSVNR